MYYITLNDTLGLILTTCTFGFDTLNGDCTMIQFYCDLTQTLKSGLTSDGLVQFNTEGKHETDIPQHL